MHLTSLTRHLSSTWDTTKDNHPGRPDNHGEKREGRAFVPMTAGRLFLCSWVFCFVLFFQASVTEWVSSHAQTFRKFLNSGN